MPGDSSELEYSEEVPGAFLQNKNISASMQKRILVLLVRYDPRKLGPGWFYSWKKKEWVFESGATAPQVFILPSFRLSVLQPERNDAGCFIYSPYCHWTVQFSIPTVFYAHSVRDNETYDLAQMPVKYEAYVPVPPAYVNFVPYSSTQGWFKRKTIWLRAAPVGVEIKILKQRASYQPVVKQWVVQYELDYKNRVVPVLADTGFYCIPSTFDRLIPSSVLTRDNYVDMLLPALQPLDESNFLHPDLLGMWDNCPETLVEKLDAFLIVCASRFWNEICRIDRIESESHIAGIRLFEEALLSNALPFLGVLGFLDKHKVASFISRVAYIASPCPQCAFNAQEEIFYARVKRDLELLLSGHSREFPLNSREKQSMAVYKNPARAIKSVANKIVRCLLSVQNVHLLRARLVHFAGPNFLFGFE